MIPCARLSDRMPEVLRAGAPWADAERRHLAQCVDCAAEWELVQVAARLGDRAGYEPDAGLLATQIHARVRNTMGRPSAPAAWRSAAAVVGLAAAALLVVNVWRSAAPREHAASPDLPALALPVPSGATAAAEAGLPVPVLDSLDSGELRMVLDAFDEALAERQTIVLPSPAELTDTELTRVLRAGGV
ncbi:MAG: hypothetical protein H0U85_08760 [Gemmatimonadales bacterium]|nr:hypothetical protein [Gemmatimonadales bacterium]